MNSVSWLRSRLSTGSPSTSRDFMMVSPSFMRAIVSGQNEEPITRGSEIAICDATVAEFLAGEPIKDEGKRKRFREFWETVGSQLPSFPLDRAVCERAGALLLRARTQRRIVCVVVEDHRQRRHSPHWRWRQSYRRCMDVLLVHS